MSRLEPEYCAQGLGLNYLPLLSLCICVSECTEVYQDEILMSRHYHLIAMLPSCSWIHRTCPICVLFHTVYSHYISAAHRATITTLQRDGGRRDTASENERGRGQEVREV